MKRCKTCGGEYETVLKDGTDYYHACAPIETAEGKIMERPDARDENIGKKKEGKGVEDVAIEEII